MEHAEIADKEQQAILVFPECLQIHPITYEHPEPVTADKTVVNYRVDHIEMATEGIIIKRLT